MVYINSFLILREPQRCFSQQIVQSMDIIVKWLYYAYRSCRARAG
jgi:hypothetical protein